MGRRRTFRLKDRAVRPGVAGGQREGYAAALTGLWKRLSWALTELESIAGDPAELFDEDSVLDRLPSLQYALHAASELALGLRPPAGAEIAHAELAAALAGARDATAEIAEVLARGDALAATVLALTGATVFATGATLQLWPVWALGLALFASGVLVYSARP